MITDVSQFTQVVIFYFLQNPGVTKLKVEYTLIFFSKGKSLLTGPFF